MKVFGKIRNWFFDIFFARPYLFDVLTAIILEILAYYLDKYGLIDVSKVLNQDKILEQLGTSVITIAGFVLTILTIVVTFKNSEDSKKTIVRRRYHKRPANKVTLFFSSKLYFKTVRVLHQSVFGLTLIFILFITIELISNSICGTYKFYFIVFGLIVSILIFLRCILTLSLIIELQTPEKKDDLE